ncbi:uncharacterized protein K452DRAFT_310611 [Aplosporella prunicola CBS 121167]|uniref:BTB domain-containing protein n=1 Tax=Aplosporella prunicola CBS 121167 TaxID=1176127 RepID=A0A6A6B9X0_9PEZI|nr:uncharacterized protein K452DRAFT_310611 [Aplosporella prunicola CBS 121167]KAF2139707.1 hypothetical protein K452DRAFT_310611 [Aplosporella prunicola CBS 121167]
MAGNSSSNMTAGKANTGLTFNFFNMTRRELAELFSGNTVTLVVDTSGTQRCLTVHAKMLEALTVKTHVVTDNKLVFRDVASAAVKVLVDWMVTICKTGNIFKVPVQNTFGKNVMLMKAALELGIADAENTIWQHLKSDVCRLEFEAEHLAVMNTAFDRNSRIVNHVAANLEWMQHTYGLADSANAYLLSHPGFAALVNEKRYERIQKQKAKRAAAKAVNTQVPTARYGYR